MFNVKEYQKAYYQANKKKLLENASNYSKKNKDKLTDYYSDRYSKKRESIRKQESKSRAKKKHKPVVYLIVKENYVGITELLDERLRSHKRYNKDISEVIILCECETRKEALEIEAALHKEGYAGSALRS